MRTEANYILKAEGPARQRTGERKPPCSGRPTKKQRSLSAEAKPRAPAGARAPGRPKADLPGRRRNLACPTPPPRLPVPPRTG